MPGFPVDVVSLHTDSLLVGGLNMLLVWGTLHQLGYAWRDGTFRRRAWAALLGVGGLLGALALVMRVEAAVGIALELRLEVGGDQVDPGHLDAQRAAAHLRRRQPVVLEPHGIGAGGEGADALDLVDGLACEEADADAAIVSVG